MLLLSDWGAGSSWGKSLRARRALARSEVEILHVQSHEIEVLQAPTILRSGEGLEGMRD